MEKKTLPFSFVWKLTALAILVAAMICSLIAGAISTDALITDLPTVQAAEPAKPSPTPTPHPVPKPKQTKWSDFKVTAYGNDCAIWNEKTKTIGPSKTGLGASGIRGQNGYTVAADPKVLPIWSIVHIAGIGQFVVTDTGPIGNHIDLFLDDCDEAKQFGERYGMRAKRIR